MAISQYENGTSQNDRMLPALNPDYIPVDERSQEQFLAFAPEFGKLINYYNEKNELDGDWFSFFISDVKIITVIIATADPERVANEFNQTLQAQAQALATTSDKDAQLRLLSLFSQTVLAKCWGLLKQLNEWHIQINKIADNHPILLKLTQGIQEQAAHDRQAIRHLEATSRHVAYHTDVDAFPKDATQVSSNGFDSTLWQAPAPAVKIEVACAPLSLDESIGFMNQIIKQTTHTFWSIYSTYTDIVEFAVKEYERTKDLDLSRTPNVALYSAFLSVFQNTLDEINRITERHLNFYYKKVLRQSPQPAIPDRVYVAFSLADDAEATTLKPGTLLNAGEDDEGNTTLYQTDKELEVTSTNIAQVSTLFVSSKPNPSATALDSGLYLGIAPDADDEGNEEDEEDDAVQPTLRRPWPTLGRDQTKFPSALQTAPLAQAGFAIAAPILELDEGTRHIYVSLTFEPPASLPGVTIMRLIECPFELQLSGEEAWITPNKIRCCIKEVLQNGEPHLLSMLITLKLEKGDDAIVPFDGEVLSGDFDTQWPVLRALFNRPESESPRYYDYPYLSQLKIDSIQINVHNKGVENLVLANDDGSLVAGETYEPFGAIPAIGSAFYVGKAAIFRKTLSELTLKLGWADLPLPPEFPLGFASYYDLYNEPPTSINPPIANDVFKAELGYLADKQWTLLRDDPSDPKPIRYHLFNDNFHDPATFLGGNAMDAVNQTIITYKASSGGALINPSPDYDLPDELEYTPETKSGFFRFQFAEPSYAFGQNYYGPLLNLVSLTNGQKLIHNEDLPEGKEAQPTAAQLVTELKKHNRGPNPLKAKLNASQFDWDSFYQSLSTLEKDLLNNREQLADSLRSFPSIAALADDNENPIEKLIIEILEFILWILKSIADKLTQFTPPPNPPYVPTIKTLSLNYKAQSEVNYKDGSAAESPIQLFHIDPFGTYDTASAETAPSVPSLMTEFEYGGYLYLKLNTLTPLKKVGVLFALNSLPAYKIVNPEPQVYWEYLSNEGWELLKSDVYIEDGTSGLMESGIIEFNFPVDISNDNPQMPSGGYWLRAHSPKPNNYPLTQRILTHPTVATWVRDSEATDHFLQPLPPYSITALEEGDPAIGDVIQPLESFDGRPAENQDQFYTRVSERLRHKQRTATTWDYEHLTLERFPWVFNAKCLKHTALPSTEQNSAITPEEAIEASEKAGHLLLIVVPRVYQASITESIAPPGISLKNLKVIKDYLKRQASIFAKIEVINPVYERVTLSADITFSANSSITQQRTRFLRDLNAYLFPWLYLQDETQKIVATINITELKHFMNDLPYVVEASKVEVTPESFKYPTGDPNVISPSCPWNLFCLSENQSLNYSSAKEPKQTT